MFELDHVFICTNIGASEADRLRSFGLMEGTSRVHSGQGTANRRFLFHNLMLELLWVDNPEEAQSEFIQPTRLWERWVNRNHVCPFGFCLRPTQDSGTSIPFSCWEYHPPYLPPSLSIFVGTNSDILVEPMLFYIAAAQRQDTAPPDTTNPFQDRVGLKEVTRVVLFSPYTEQLSSEFRTIVDANMVELRMASEYGLELGFDGEKQGKKVNFHPDLPLVFCW